MAIELFTKQHKTIPQAYLIKSGEIFNKLNEIMNEDKPKVQYYSPTYKTKEES